jgi:hypothetical protein
MITGARWVGAGWRGLGAGLQRSRRLDWHSEGRTLPLSVVCGQQQRHGRGWRRAAAGAWRAVRPASGLCSGCPTPPFPPPLPRRSEKVASDCLRATGGGIEAAIEYFYASGLQSAVPSLDMKAIEGLFARYKGAPRVTPPRLQRARPLGPMHGRASDPPISVVRLGVARGRSSGACATPRPRGCAPRCRRGPTQSGTSTLPPPRPPHRRL